MLVVTENAPTHRRGFFGAFAQAGGATGAILANLAFLSVIYLTTDQQFMSWGWRIPFLVSLLLIAYAMYTQLRMEDTDVYKEFLKKRSERKADEKTLGSKIRSPVIDAILEHPKQILLAAGTVIGTGVLFYIILVWVIAYATNPDGLALPRDVLLWAVLISLFVHVLAVFSAAAYSDLRGRKGVVMSGAVLGGIWAFAIFPLINTGNVFWITFALSVGQISVGMVYGPLAALLSEMFSTKVRYSGASLGYQLGNILGGTFAAVIATWLWASFGLFYIAVYMAVAQIITVVSIYLLTETQGADLHSIGASHSR